MAAERRRREALDLAARQEADRQARLVAQLRLERMGAHLEDQVVKSILKLPTCSVLSIY